jgi:hypothetical protein
MFSAWWQTILKTIYGCDYRYRRCRRNNCMRQKGYLRACARTAGTGCCAQYRIISATCTWSVITDPSLTPVAATFLVKLVGEVGSKTQPHLRPRPSLTALRLSASSASGGINVSIARSYRGQSVCLPRPQGLIAPRLSDRAPALDFAHLITTMPPVDRTPCSPA